MKINCHCHIFSLDCVPLEFRRRFFLDLKHPVQEIAHRAVRKLLPDNSMLEDWLELTEMSIFEIAHLTSTMVGSAQLHSASSAEMGVHSRGIGSSGTYGTGMPS